MVSIEFTDIAPAIGASVQADIGSLLSVNHALEIREALEARGVLVFPQIAMTDEQQVAFTRTLGELIEEGDNGIYKITLDKRENANAEYTKGAFFWHIDSTTLDVPILASVLSAQRLSREGGDTEFCNTYAAYDALSDAEKAQIDDLTVVHSLENAQLYVHPEPSYAMLQAWRRLPSNELPLVWKHRSGRKSLVLGSTASHIVGKSLEESRERLCRLRDWATQPQFSYRHQWQLGDLVIWDNTGTMHRATWYPENSGRLMHRTKLAGEEPFK